MIAQLLCFPKQTALLKGLEFCFLCDTSQSICDFFFLKADKLSGGHREEHIVLDSIEQSLELPMQVEIFRSYERDTRRIITSIKGSESLWKKPS